jgi:hypothetical protein
MHTFLYVGVVIQLLTCYSRMHTFLYIGRMHTGRMRTVFVCLEYGLSFVTVGYIYYTQVAP